MEEEVEIRITMQKADAEMLIDLAGEESKVSQYLTLLVRKLHRENHVLSGDLRLEELIAEAQVIIDTNEEYRKTIRVLQGRLKTITLSHEELMATVQHLRGNVSRSTTTSNGTKH